MNKKDILYLKSKGYGMDAVYQLAAGELGIFGVAFFGHKAKKGDKAKLRRVWLRIVKAFEG